MKRIMLFAVTNIAILVVLSIVMSLLGVEPYLQQNGLNLTSLLIFSAIFGMGGSFISLAMSKWMAKRMTGAKVIDTPTNEIERWLLSTVQSQAQRAGIGMPEVAIYDAPDMNAFATGASRNNALVAVSTGLLRTMSREEAEAVLAHEISHVANGDMITLALIQGVVNTFVIFLSRVIGYLVDKVLLKNERGYGIGYFVATMVAQIVLGILASIVVNWFSRQREYRADAGGAGLAGSGNMINALRKLQLGTVQSQLPEQMAAFGISSSKSTMMQLFTTHPPLEKRIAALENRKAGISG